MKESYLHGSVCRSPKGKGLAELITVIFSRILDENVKNFDKK